VILAADLQDPPETIPQLVEKWRGGAKVVWAVRAAREGESLGTKFFSALYWRLMRRYAEVEPPKAGADFLLVDRRIVAILRDSPEKHTSLLALIQWMGFPQDSITYVKQERHSGRSKWTLRKKLKLAVDSFASFSYFPISRDVGRRIRVRPDRIFLRVLRRRPSRLLRQPGARLARDDVHGTDRRRGAAGDARRAGRVSLAGL
jgi:hypothetical protein